MQQTAAFRKHKRATVNQAPDFALPAHAFGGFACRHRTIGVHYENDVLAAVKDFPEGSTDSVDIGFEAFGRRLSADGGESDSDGLVACCVQLLYHEVENFWTMPGAGDENKHGFRHL